MPWIFFFASPTRTQVSQTSVGMKCHVATKVILVRKEEARQREKEVENVMRKIC